MLAVLGNAVIHYRKWILVAGVIGFLYAGAIGGNVAKHLSSGGFDDSHSESSRASTTLEHTFKTGDPNFILLVTAKRGTVDSPEVVARGSDLTKRLGSESSVVQAVSYWSLSSAPPLRSKDGRQAMVLARVVGSQDHVRDVVKQLSPRYAGGDDVITVGVGGFGEIFRQVSSQIEKDLAKAEGITLPVVLLLLVVVFGSVVAAGLPVAIGVIAIVGTFLLLRVMAQLTEVSIFSLNLATGMGLGLAVDYSLFMVSRYREELRNGLPTYPAIIRTIETAGRTVAFGAVTVAASLTAMLIFPLSFLRSFAYAGIGVVALAGLGAVVFLPALLAVLGSRIDRFVLWRREPKPVGEGFWHGVATVVMRRPLIIGGGVVALLLFLGAPFLGAKFGLPDDRVLPSGASSRNVSEQLRKNFDAQEAGALTVVADNITYSEARKADVNRYAESLSRLPNVGRVDAVTGFYRQGRPVAPALPVSLRFVAPTGTFFSVVPTVDPQSDAARHLVRDVRALPRPFPVIVGGPSAQLVDSEHSIFGRMPWAAGIIAVITFIVLFLFTGSLLVPVKALVLNVLSLSATFGAMVWIFQQGHLSKALSFTATGNLDTTTPILMFCVAFGLSMDYEVFLLSRIKEEYDRTGDNVSSVAIGLEKTGRLVTAAAGLLAIVFIAFATSKITFIKLFGVGLALAIVMDATLVRAALVPAFMRLAGRANWWAPRPLRRFHDRYGIREADGPPIVPRPEPVTEPVA
jgi:RND superfamily putative drug exporter